MSKFLTTVCKAVIFVGVVGAGFGAKAEAGTTPAAAAAAPYPYAQSCYSSGVNTDACQLNETKTRCSATAAALASQYKDIVNACEKSGVKNCKGHVNDCEDELDDISDVVGKSFMGGSASCPKISLACRADAADYFGDPEARRADAKSDYQDAKQSVDELEDKERQKKEDMETKYQESQTKQRELREQQQNAISDLKKKLHDIDQKKEEAADKIGDDIQAIDEALKKADLDLDVATERNKADIRQVETECEAYKYSEKEKREQLDKQRAAQTGGKLERSNETAALQSKSRELQRERRDELECLNRQSTKAKIKTADAALSLAMKVHTQTVASLKDRRDKLVQKLSKLEDQALQAKQEEHDSTQLSVTQLQNQLVESQTQADQTMSRMQGDIAQLDQKLAEANSEKQKTKAELDSVKATANCVHTPSPRATEAATAVSGLSGSLKSYEFQNSLYENDCKAALGSSFVPAPVVTGKAK